ncbi:hypothetical protein KFK09_012321 [Dendrobium nobile]|uniref:Uncharacterized protein n=1 Tax=Dendrobium nobile TaxID=94219 RepID=A0A8T3BF01_DENNO|nr:hypothetical protein KFK09_012321 [Dendrobium nobile]
MWHACDKFVCGTLGLVLIVYSFGLFLLEYFALVLKERSVGKKNKSGLFLLYYFAPNLRNKL